MGASTLQQILNYSNPANFSFDASLIEFVGSIAKLKKLTNNDETAFGNFTTKDLFRAVGGSLVGTLGGTAAIANGRLNISGDTIGDWSFNPSGQLGADPRVGMIRFKYIPLYSGTPPNTQIIFLEQDLITSNLNQIFIQHTDTGDLTITFRDNAGGGQGVLIAIAGWSPNASQVYEFELNFNSITGTQKFYLDGVNVGPDITAVYIRTAATINLVAYGSVGFDSNFEIDDYQRFGVVIHTADFAAEVPRVVSLTDFDITGPPIINNSGVLADALENFAETTSAVIAPDDIQYIINVSGQDKYWDGSAWANSDGSLAQSNTPEVVEANKAALDLALGATIKIKTLLVSGDGTTTPEIETVTIDYNFFNTQAQPSTATVWGFYRDVSGKGVEGATVTFSLVRSNKQYREAGDAIIEKVVAVLTDINGRFESDLIRSSAYEHVGTVYKVTVTKPDPDKLDTTVINAAADDIIFDVPDIADVNITSLITAIA